MKAVNLRGGASSVPGNRRPGHLYVVCAAALALALVPAPALGTEDQVANVLDKLPANTPTERTELRQALIGLDPSSIARLCGMLVEPGTGDDTKPRMALHGLALCAAQPGAQHIRRSFAQVVGLALQSDATPAVKAFLIRQLQIAGGPDAVPVLAIALTNDELCPPAARALLTIGGDEAKAALRKALAARGTAPGAPADGRLAVIDALGGLRDQEAASLLLEHAKSDDDATRLAALGALASIGDPAAADVLLDAMGADSWQRRADTTALALKFASRLAEAGHKDRAIRILRRIRESEVGPEFAHVQAAALHGLAEVLGPDAVSEVVAALTSDNPEIRAAAMNVAVALSGHGVTQAYITQLDQASPASRASILTVLGRRGDDVALPAAVAALKDQDKGVRLAAVTAAAALGKAKAVDAFVEFLSTRQEDEKEAAQAALVRMPGETVSKKIAAAIAEAPATVRVALLEVLSDRRADGQLDVVFAATGHSDEDVRVAAVTAVGVLGDANAVPKLLGLLSAAASGRERDALEAALSATCNRALEPARRAEPVLAAIQPGNLADYISLLRVLGRIGGHDALHAVRAALKDTRPEIRETAFQALTEWPDPEAANEVLEIARSTDDTKYQVLALRGYLRLVSLDPDRAVDETLAMYEAGMQASRRVEEKRLVLSKLGEVPARKTLELLRPYLTDETLGAEAASAMINVASGLLPAGWAPACEALDEVLAVTTADGVRQRANEVLQQAAEYEGFIDDWLVAGPYMQDGKPGNEILEVPFPAEQPEATGIEWRKQPVTDDPARYWFVDLNRPSGGAHRAAYLLTQVYSPQAQDVRLELGSDDGVKVWLNRELIHTKNTHRGCERGDDRVNASLKEGYNELLLKVTNDDGGWGACARFRAPDGGRLKGVYAKAQPEP